MKIYQALLVSMISLSAQVDANCGATSCPIIDSFIKKKGVEIGIRYEQIDQTQLYQHAKPYSLNSIGQNTDFSLTHKTPAGEIETLSRTIIGHIGIDLLPEWRLNAKVPYIIRTHSHSDHGTKTWEMSGLGDTTITMTHHSTHWGTSLGVKIPTGVIRLKNTVGTEAEVALQPGSGSTDFIAGVYYENSLLAVPNLDGNYIEIPIIFGAQYTFSGTGTNDWRFGNSALFSTGTRYNLTKKFALTISIQGKLQDPADVGNTGEQSEHTGGTWIYLTPGIDYRITPTLTLETAIQVPVYQKFNGIQLTAPYNLQIGLIAML